MRYGIKNLCSILGLIIDGIDTNIKNLTILMQKSFDKKKINIIMICACTQMFINNHMLLQNSPSWPQFKITSADQGRISLPVYYSFCSFTKRVKSLQEELK